MGSDLVSAEEARGLLAGARGPFSLWLPEPDGDWRIVAHDTPMKRRRVVAKCGYAKEEAAMLAAAPNLARTVVALSEDLAEARATLDNERGEGEPPSDGWRWDGACWVRDLPSNEQLRVSWDATGLDTELPRWRCWLESADDWGGAFIVPSAPTARAAMRDADKSAEAARG